MREYYLRWLKSIFLHSFGVADGVAGLIGMLLPPLALAFHWPTNVVESLGWQVPVCVLLLLALGRVVLSPYWLHVEDAVASRKIVEERNQLQVELQSRRPNLSLQIFQTIKIPSEAGLWIAIKAAVSNLGDPSIADIWRLNVRLPDGHSFEMAPHALLPDLKFVIGEAPSAILIPGEQPRPEPKVIALAPETALYTRCLIPIPTGGRTSGNLLFLERSNRYLAIDAAVLELSCKDALGRRISATFEMNGGQTESPTMIYPGVD